jgi:hypothetical protein
MLLDLNLHLDDQFGREDARAMAAPLAGLDVLDLSVIRLSLKDRLQTALPASRSSRWLAALFGMSPARSLADPRLEALRRYCVLARHRHPGEEGAWSLLSQLGFARTQRQLIDALIV